MILVEILPNLYIGDIESLKYKSNLNITAIINCAKDLKSLDSYSNYVYDIKKNIEKYELVKMYQYLSESVNYIHKNMLNDKSVLIFCENANQKASTVAASYLIKYGKLSLDDAIKVIRTKNKTSFFPNIDFYNALQMIDNDNNA